MFNLNLNDNLLGIIVFLLIVFLTFLRFFLVFLILKYYKLNFIYNYKELDPNETGILKFFYSWKYFLVITKIYYSSIFLQDEYLHRKVLFFKILSFIRLILIIILIIIIHKIGIIYMRL